MGFSPDFNQPSFYVCDFSIKLFGIYSVEMMRHGGYCSESVYGSQNSSTNSSSKVSVWLQNTCFCFVLFCLALLCFPPISLYLMEPFLWELFSEVFIFKEHTLNSSLFLAVPCGLWYLSSPTNNLLLMPYPNPILREWVLFHIWTPLRLNL